MWLQLVISSQLTGSNTINTLFFALKTATITTDIHVLESCSQTVKRWFLENDLMLNADKSEVMLFGSGASCKRSMKQNLLKVADVALPTVNNRFIDSDSRRVGFKT